MMNFALSHDYSLGSQQLKRPQQLLHFCNCCLPKLSYLYLGECGCGCKNQSLL